MYDTWSGKRISWGHDAMTLRLEQIPIHAEMVYGNDGRCGGFGGSFSLRIGTFFSE